MTILNNVPYTEARGMRIGAWKKRKLDPVANIWHTTGAGPARRHLANPKKFPTTFDAAVFIYQKLMKAGAHFVIGQEGQIIQMAPINYSAWHVGRARSAGYFTSSGVYGGRYGWWRDRWNPWGVALPTELAEGKLWRGRQCNLNTIGIEIAPPAKKPWGEWSTECWAAMKSLTWMLEKHYGIPIDPMFQLGHADAHPRSRTNRRGIGWDPHPNAWDPWTHCKRVRG